MSAANRGTPPPLQTIGEQASQIIVAVADSNWPRARAHVQELAEVWQQYKYPGVVPMSYPRPPASLFRGPLDGAMFRLRFAAGKGLSRETMKAADEVAAAAVVMFESCAPPAACDLHRLRMLEGRILVDTVEDHPKPASDALGDARGVWRRMRPVVEAEFNPDLVTALDDILAAQQTALKDRDREALGAHTKEAIRTVNEMQRLACVQQGQEEPDAGDPNTPGTGSH